MPKPTAHESNLDSTQRRAVESDARTILVSGGPGTGKTHLITERAAYLVRSRDVPLASILLLTFSATAGMRVRRDIEKLIRRSYTELHIHTYHSLARMILDEYASTRGASSPKLITPFREYLVVKEILRTDQAILKSKLKDVSSTDGLAREIADFFGMLRQNLIPADIFSELAKNLSPQLRDLALLYSAYDKFLIEKNWIGVRDAVARAVEILSSNTKLLAHYHNKFEHILVDEFQEIDYAQFRLLKLLAGKTTSLFVVGDEEQRIYRFRGSVVGQFSHIAKEGVGGKRFTLKENHRLSSTLLRASENLIVHNRRNEEETEPVVLDHQLGLRKYKDAIEQAYGIAREIKCRVLDSQSSAKPFRYSDFAIICRSTVRSAFPLEEAFSYYDVPYVLHSSTSFYRHPMVRCIADIARRLCDSDDDAGLLRILSAPAFGLDPFKLRKIANRQAPVYAEGLYKTLRKAITQNGDAANAENLDEHTAARLKEFFDYIEENREQAHKTDCPSALIHSVMNELFFKEIVENEDVDAGIRDARNLRSLYEVITDIEEVLMKTRGKCTLADITEYMEYAFVHFSSQKENDPADDSGDSVEIMTVHQAKGMEFPFVFLIDMTDECFPQLGRSISLLDGRSLNQLATAIRKHSKDKELSSISFQPRMDVREQLEEERQLAYVAISRASREATICYIEESQLFDPVQPSPFIDEILGASLESFIQESDEADDLSDVHSLLASSLNKQEIESALRTCVSRLGPKSEDEAAELFSFFKSQGLDARFICEETPFEGEPPRCPDLSGHRYSASQLATYLTCPRQFFYEKLLRIAPERPEDFGLGQLIHMVLERFHADVKDFGGEQSSLEAALIETFMIIWQGDPASGREEHHREAFCLQYPAVLQRETIRRRAEEILRRYIRTEVTQSRDKEIITCEKNIDFRVGDFPFVARIDRIDGGDEGHHIVDYKTSASGPMGSKTIKKKFLNVDNKPDYAPQDFQLPLYLLAARSAGLDPARLVYYWLAQKDSTGLFKKSALGVGGDEPDSLTSHDMEVAEESIIGIVELICGGSYAAEPKSPFECARCSFDFICDVVDEDAAHNES